MSNPYADLTGDRFWKTGVAETSPLDPTQLYEKRWPIWPKARIATAGSCFAQHIARYLRANGYQVLDAEKAPEGLDPAHHAAFGFSMYSARYGNIYTVRQLLQLIEEAIAGEPRDDIVWETDGRYYDALRPGIEPEGYGSAEELLAHRKVHISAVRRLLRDLDVFVFTLGLTEAWTHSETGRVYPIAPGTIAGRFDPDQHVFHNFTFQEIRADLTRVLNLIRQFRQSPFRMVLTVSPVPLTATAEPRHVLQSSTYSKAVLRAVAGQIYADHPNVDYFPSYEIVTNPAARGVFFAPNLRSVTPQGVEVVMKAFFAQHPPQGAVATSATTAADLQCEEAMLEAFAK